METTQREKEEENDEEGEEKKRRSRMPHLISASCDMSNAHDVFET
jgi:hypothetical protein